MLQMIFFSGSKTKDDNIMIYRKNLFDQPVKNDRRTDSNIATGQGDD